MDWVEIEKLFGAVLSKILRRTNPDSWTYYGTDMIAAKVQAIKDVYVMLHTLAGHNGCAEKCWQQMLEASEKAVKS